MTAKSTNKERALTILKSDSYYAHPHTGCIQLGSEWADEASDWDEITEDKAEFGDETNTIEMQANEFELIYELDLYKMYDDMIDECNEEITISGMRYCASRVLKYADPIAYRCGFSDYIDSLR